MLRFELFLRFIICNFKESCLKKLYMIYLIWMIVIFIWMS